MSRTDERAFKLAFIGSHGVGKTTLCYGLAARLKARDVSLEVVDEVARRCPLPINRGTTCAAQSWILHTQIADELLAADRHEMVICDRSVLDNYVYLLLAAGRQPALEALVDAWMATYDLLVHVPILDGPRSDGLRSTDPAFQNAVEERLEKEIARRGLSVLSLEGDDRDAWLAAVEEAAWSRLRPAQLELL
ncbi:MAG: hypothetical protein D6696_17020 [Acidobacteria bacterium]|nr:MAG: hypothetical protein D6696_17020 [Acidobacteriota bacterium]